MQPADPARRGAVISGGVVDAMEVVSKATVVGVAAFVPLGEKRGFPNNT